MPVAEGDAVKMGRIGFDLIAAILGSAFLGWLVDRQFGTKPWGMLIILLFGFIGAGFSVWRALYGAKKK